MDIDVITQYVLAIVPAFTAVVGMVTTLGVAIGRIKRANRDTVSEVKSVSQKTIDYHEKLERELTSVHRENAELKKELNTVMKQIKHIHVEGE